jgi:hypothetical protein
MNGTIESSAQLGDECALRRASALAGVGPTGPVMPCSPWRRTCASRSTSPRPQGRGSTSSKSGSGIIERQAIHRGIFASVRELMIKIRTFNQRLERPLPPLHLDQDRRPDPQEKPTVNNSRCGPQVMQNTYSRRGSRTITDRLTAGLTEPQVSTDQAFFAASGSGIFLLLSRRSHTNGRSSTSFSSGDTPPAPEPKYRTPLL